MKIIISAKKLKELKQASKAAELMQRLIFLISDKLKAKTLDNSVLEQLLFELGDSSPLGAKDKVVRKGMNDVLTKWENELNHQEEELAKADFDTAD